MEVCLWDLCPNPHHQSLNMECPCHSMDYLNPPLSNSIAGSHESVLINPPFSICNELGMDKDMSWTDPFLVYSNEEEVKPKIEPVTVNSPVVGSSHSGFEEQHSEICVEDQQSELSDENDTKKASEAEEIVDSKSKKRKRSTEKGPKFAFKTRSKEDVLEDGYKWRKYGKKIIKSSPYPRSYYRCSDSNCGVKKRVERDPKDQTMLITTYEGKHNHESPSVIYYIGKPIVLQQPGSKPAIVLVNAGLCS